MLQSDAVWPRPLRILLAFVTVLAAVSGSFGAARAGAAGTVGAGADAMGEGGARKEKTSSSRPNILLILADDLGFSDLGCYGGEIDTPNLDRLAGNGLRYTQFYNTSRCWASRASLLTGHYPQAIRRDLLPEVDRGEYGMFGKVSGANGVRPRWALALPVLLRAAGYRSYHSGKWHLDGARLAAGFDRSYSLEDHNRFFSPKDHYLDDVKQPAVAPGSGYYATTAIADHALQCLRDHAAQHPGTPFFSFVAFTAPHFPLQALPQDIALYRKRYGIGWDQVRAERHARQRTLGIANGDLSPLEPDAAPRWNLTAEEQRAQIGPGEVARAVPWVSLTREQRDFQAEKMAIHAAMLHRMDLEIGRLLDQLRAAGALENTLVLFLSDNGASPEQILRGDGHDRNAPLGSARTYLGLGHGWSSAANTPFRLHKSWTHEGGITTPFIAHWPAGIAARGALRSTPGHVIDLLPTLLELTGASLPGKVEGLEVPPLPGRSLAPTFVRDGAVERECLWFYHDGNRALRAGDWKIVAEFGAPWELYDLRTDRAERRNLATLQPERVRAMERLWERETERCRQLAAQDLPAAPALPAVDPNARRKETGTPPAGASAAGLPTGKTNDAVMKVAFKLRLKPGMAAEYEKRHAAIWPELSQAIRNAGIGDYTIFLDAETNTLISVQKLQPGNTAAELRKTEILQRWWAYMAPLMEVNPDNSPVRVPLRAVFHQD